MSPKHGLARLNAKKSPIELPEEAQRKLDQEREQAIQVIQGHLDVIKEKNSQRGQLQTALMIAAVKHGGLPLGDEAGIDALISTCDRIAERTVSLSRTRVFGAMRDLYRDLGLKEAPEHMVYAARDAGVELFPEQEENTPAGPDEVQ